MQYNGYIISTLMYIMGEFASDEFVCGNEIYGQINSYIVTIYEECLKPENKKLKEPARISVLLDIMKLFFKYCNTHRKEEVGDVLKHVTRILDWYTQEMSDSLEIYELLNFYVGIIKNFDTFDFDELKRLLNAGFAEELQPVRKEVCFAFQFLSRLREASSPTPSSSSPKK